MTDEKRRRRNLKSQHTRGTWGHRSSVKKYNNFILLNNDAFRWCRPLQAPTFDVSPSKRFLEPTPHADGMQYSLSGTLKGTEKAKKSLQKRKPPTWRRRHRRRQRRRDGGAGGDGGGTTTGGDLPPIYLVWTLGHPCWSACAKN